MLRQNLNSLGPLSSPVTSSSGGLFNFSTTGAWTTGPFNTSAAAPIGEDFAEFLYGLPTSGSYVIPATYAEHTNTLSAYVQDDWKVSTKLTLSVGLRYELPGGLSERYNRTVAGFAVDNGQSHRGAGDRQLRGQPDCPNSCQPVQGQRRFDVCRRERSAQRTLGHAQDGFHAAHRRGVLARL